MRNTTKNSVRGWKGASLLTLAALAVPAMAAPAWSVTDHRAPGATTSGACTSLEDDGWVATQCPGNPAEFLISKTFTLTSLATQNGITKACPDVDEVIYRLRNKDFSPNRAVPRGVEVTENGGVGVTALIEFDADNFANGVRSMSMSNWTTKEREVKVVLHCTSETTQWYS